MDLGSKHKGKRDCDRPRERPRLIGRDGCCYAEVQNIKTSQQQHVQRLANSEGCLSA